jgi:CHASE2 domain-containing sensor protein
MPPQSRIVTAIRPFTRRGVGHWLRFTLLLTVGWYVGHLLSASPWLTQLRYALYHRQLMMRDRAKLYPKRTVLMLVNDDDYWGDEFQARSPLKRDVLAELLDRLNAAGVNTVALDVDLRSPRPNSPGFEFPDYKQEDAKLIEAIGRMCAAGRHVVLASSISFDSDGYHEMPSIYTSALPSLPCVQKGYIQLPFDMRRAPGTLDLAGGGHLDSLSLAVTGIADPTAHDTTAADNTRGFRFSEYLTAADFAPRDGKQFVFSGQQLTQMKPEQLRNQLADKIVFLGANWHSNAYGTGPMVDLHASPGGPEPGVMLHANYVEAMLDRTGTFAPLADSTGEFLEVILVLALALVGALEIHSAWKWAAFAFACMFSLVLTYTLLQNLGVFLDFLVPFMIILFHTIAEEFMGMLHELRHSRLESKGLPDEVLK